MQKNAFDRELTDHLSLNTEKINTSIHVFNAKNNAFDKKLEHRQFVFKCRKN